MAQQLNTSFTRFELSSQEQIHGQILTPLNCLVIQNLLAQNAEEKMKLKFDPEKPSVFIQREAELQGTIGILQFLLDSSEEATKLLQQLQLNLETSTSDNKGN